MLHSIELFINAAAFPINVSSPILSLIEHFKASYERFKASDEHFKACDEHFKASDEF